VSPIHTLVLTGHGRTLRHTVECPGVTNACRMLMPCDDPDCLHDDCPPTPSDRCYFLVADELVPDTLPEAVRQLVDRENLGPGRYPITYVFGDAGVDELALVNRPRPSARPAAVAAPAAPGRWRAVLRWVIVIAIAVIGLILTRSLQHHDHAEQAPAGWIRVSCEPWMGDPAGPCYAPPEQLTPLAPQCGPLASPPALPCYTPEPTTDPTGRTVQ
jgi:hypothetical protein